MIESDLYFLQGDIIPNKEGLILVPKFSIELPFAYMSYKECNGTTGVGATWDNTEVECRRVQGCQSQEMKDINKGENKT